MTQATHDTIAVNVNGAQNFIVFDVPRGTGDGAIAIGIESENIVVGGEDAEPILEGSNDVSVFRNGEEITSLKRGQGSYFTSPTA